MRRANARFWPNASSLSRQFQSRLRVIQDKTATSTGWTTVAPLSHAQRMVRRRNPPPDGYKLNDNEQRFLIVESMVREILSCEPLPLGVDLRATITAARQRMAAQGWAVEELAVYSPYFFAVRDGQRVEVSIGIDPATRLDRMYRR